MKSCSKFTAGPSLQRICAITLHAAEVVLAPVCWADLTVGSEDRGCNLVIEEFPAASVPSDTQLSKRLLKLTGIPCFLSVTKGIKFKFKQTNASTLKYQMSSHFQLPLCLGKVRAWFTFRLTCSVGCVLVSSPTGFSRKPSYCDT